MADSNYPEQLDTDVNLPRVDNNVTEIGSEAINGLRSAVFNIEKTFGISPHGTATDLATRLAVALNPDGTIKASALASVGLVTLPITNSQVASNAGIEETKLDLDYTTVFLKTQIDELDVFTTAMNNRLITDIANLAQHIAHPGTFGRHETQDIDGYVGDFNGYNLQGIITDINDRFVSHVGESKVGAHLAANISVDDTDTVITADNVQVAVEELDRLQETLMIQHRDELHSNGILQTQDVPQVGYNHGTTVIASATLLSTVIGNKFVQFAAVPSGFASVVRGDRIDVTLSSGTFQFFVDNINTSTGLVNIFGSVPETSTTASAIIYRGNAEITAPSVLALARRQDDVIQLVHPQAPFVLSSGLDGRKITTGANNVRLRWATGDTGDLDVKTSLETFVSTTPSTWTPENIATALNELFRTEPGNHFPFIAFTYRGEVGIAFDEADGHLEIVTPTTTSAWAELGFTEGDIAFASGPRKLFADGYEYSTIRKKLQTTGQISPGGIDTIASGLLTSAGVQEGDLVRVTGSSSDADNRTFVISGVAPTAIIISEHAFIGIGSTGTIEIYSDAFSLLTPPSTPTLYEIFADGYNNQTTQLRGAKRVESSQTTTSPQNLEQKVDVVDVSRNFSASNRRIFFDTSANTMQFGQQGAGITLASGTEGPAVTLPAADEEGFRFKLFDASMTDYIELEISDVLPGSDNALDIEIFDRTSDERYVQLGVALHDTSEFKHLSDRRLFGTVGAKDLRDDAVRDFTDYPRSLLRGNGVIYGFSVAAFGTGHVDVDGGVVLANGSLRTISSIRIVVPADGSLSTYNVFVDGDGVLRFLKDDQFVTGASTPSLAEIVASDDKTIIAQVDVNASDVITAVRDYRRFVNKIDDKIELIVEENAITNGSFASLRAAVNYINALDSSLPVQRTIRVRGAVLHDLSTSAGGSLALPDGTTLQGDGGLDDVSGLATILLQNTNTTRFLELGDNCSFRDLAIESDTASSTSAILGAPGNVNGLEIRNCTFKNVLANAFVSITGILNRSVISNTNVLFGSGGATNIGISVTSSVTSTIIENCIFDYSSSSATLKTVFSSSFSIADVIFSKNKITDCIKVVDASSSITRCSFSENTITNSTEAAGKLFDMVSSTSVNIVNNFISISTSTGDPMMEFTTSATNVRIDNNIISGAGVDDVVVDLTSGADVSISGNIISKSSAATSSTSLIKITDSQRIIIEGNNISTTSTTSPPVGAMIHVVESSGPNEDIVVDGNNLLNTDTLNAGILTGIFFDSDTVGDHTDINICNNVIRNFKGNSSSCGLCLEGVSKVIIDKNNISECRMGIGLGFISVGCENIHITNNEVFGAGEASPFELVFLQSAGDAGSVIVNNTFADFNTTVSQDLFLTNFNDSIIANNRLIHSAASVIGFKLATISGNRVMVTSNAFLNSSGTYTVNPVSLAFDVVASNNFFSISSVPSASGMILRSFGASEFSNIGQTYVVNLPPSSFVAHVDETTGLSSWETSGLGASAQKSNFVSTEREIDVVFGSDIIPVGATITKAEIWHTSAGATTDYQTSWTELKNFGPSGTQTTLKSASDFVGNIGTNEIETVTPSPLPVMTLDQSHAIRISCQNISGGWFIIVFGVRVTYTL